MQHDASGSNESSLCVRAASSRANEAQAELQVLELARAAKPDVRTDAHDVDTRAFRTRSRELLLQC